MFLLNENTAFTLSESIKFHEYLKTNSKKIESFLNKIVSKVAKNSITQDKLRNMKITGNIAQIKELLEPDCVQAFILSGEDGCKMLLLPLLAEYYSNSAVTNKEKEGKLLQLRSDLKEATRIANAEYDRDLKDVNCEGIEYFKDNVNNAIKPYEF